MSDAIEKVEEWACNLSNDEIRGLKDYIYHDANVRIDDWEEV